jgi:hypothetical protein
MKQTLLLPVKPRKLLTDQTESLVDEFAVVVLVHPAAGTRRVRKWNNLRLPAGVHHGPLRTDKYREWVRGQESLDSEPSDRNDELGTDDPQLLVKPVRTLVLFHSTGHAVSAAARVWSRIAARDGRYVDRASCAYLVDSCLLEPAKKRFPRSTGERTTTVRFDFAGRLTDEHNARACGFGNDWAYARSELATLAGGERGAVLVEGRR